MVPDHLPFLYQITLGRSLLSVLDSTKAPQECKCCKDSGAFTVSNIKERKGHFELCSFCTNIQVTLHNRYQIVKRVGEGNFSAVFLAQDLFSPDSPPVALKIFHAQYTDIAKEEVNCLRKLKEEDQNGAFGFLDFVLAFRHDRMHIVIVTEALLATDLFEKSTTPITAVINSGSNGKCPDYIPKLMFNLALNLYVLHERLGRIHADIKPENILLSKSDRKFKLIDFGSSFDVEHCKSYEADYNLVSWLYRAPELLVGVRFDFGVDIWSLGSVVFEACAKRPLCTSLDRTEALTELTEIVGPLPNNFPSGMYFTPGLPLLASFDEQSPSFWVSWRASNVRSLTGIKDTVFLNLLSRMLDPDPASRITIRGILEHPFLAKFMPFPLPTPTPVALSPGTKEAQENKRPAENDLDREMENIIMGMTPVKPQSKKVGAPGRKAPAVTGKRKTLTRS